MGGGGNSFSHTEIEGVKSFDVLLMLVLEILAEGGDGQGSKSCVSSCPRRPKNE